MYLSPNKEGDVGVVRAICPIRVYWDGVSVGWSCAYTKYSGPVLSVLAITDWNGAVDGASEKELRTATNGWKTKRNGNLGEVKFRPLSSKRAQSERPMNTGQALASPNLLFSCFKVPSEDDDKSGT